MSVDSDKLIEVARRYDAALWAEQRLQQRAEIAMQDDATFCRESLTIQNKRGELSAMEPSPGQIKLFNAIKQQQQRSQPVRIVYLKPRQAFLSTGTAAKFYKETAFIPGQRSIVIAHDESSSLKIFEYYKRFQQHYRPFRHVIEAPALIAPRNLESPKVEAMVWANGSRVEIDTANNVSGGRSFTARRVHLSEYAFYRDAATLMTGLLQAIPDDPDSMLVVESTANGIGDPFYELCKAARQGDNDFLFVFLAWFEHPEYQRPLDTTPDRFQESLDRIERDLQQRYFTTLEQLSWRRWAMRNKCRNKPEVFKQEYPSTPEEAFQSSGAMRIPARYVDLHKWIEPTRGELRLEQLGVKERLLFQEDSYGILSVWDAPDAAKMYCIGADVAEGDDASEDLSEGNPDYCVADVLETRVGVQVAQLRDRLTPAEFGRYLYYLGRWYNWALLGIEINGVGLGTLQTLLDMNYPQDRICRRTVYETGTGLPVGSKLGFKITGPAVREQVISGYENALANPGDGGIIIRSQVSLSELYTFQILKGKAQARPGQHDDTIFSGGHAVEARKQAIKMMLVSPQAGEQQQRNQPTRYAESRREQLRRLM